MLLVFLLGGTGCAHRYPCTDKGVAPWDPPVGGDVYCRKKKLETKKGSIEWVLHGEYLIYYPGGALAVEGQFLDGKKEGVWAQYGENGEKSREVYYVDGVLQPRLPTPDEVEKEATAGKSADEEVKTPGATTVIEGKGKLR